MAASTSLTPVQRSQRGQIAAHTSWANTEDWSARTEPARAKFLERFERQVDPDGTLDPVMRAKRAEHARQAYFTKLAFESAKVRRAKAAGNGAGDA